MPSVEKEVVVQMQRQDLVVLMSELARLYSPRSRYDARGPERVAEMKLVRFANANNLSDAWIDAVMLEFRNGPSSHLVHAA